MVKQTKDIPFSTFYIIEFFKAVKEKSSDLPDAEISRMLDVIGAYFSNEKKLLKGLEELAQHRGTNDLSIFLFDMTDRFTDFEAQALYGTMPNLVEDFMNLFRLMIQDPECVRDLKTVVGQFERDLAQSLPAPEETVPEAEETLLSFEEFYQQEILLQLDKHLSDAQKVNYLALINLLLKFEGAPENFPERIVRLARAVKELWNKAEAPQEAEHLIAQLPERLTKLIEQIHEFEQAESALFNKILHSKQIPPKEEVPAKPLTVDELLQDYFLFELEDHIGRITPILEKLHSDVSAAGWDALIKEFRSLKEISMIHGYNGIEWLSEKLIALFQKAAREHNVFSRESHQVIDKIFAEMRKIEQFAPDKKSARVIKKFERYLQELEENLAAPPQPQETGIAFTETATILSIFRNVLYQKYKKIRLLHGALQKDAVRAEIEAHLQGAAATARLLDRRISDGFLQPLMEAYQQVTGDDKAQLEQLQTIWETGLEHVNETADFSELRALFDNLQKMPAAEDQFTLQNDEQIRAALDDVHRRLWQQTEPSVKPFFLQQDAAAAGKLKSYFTQVRNNLQLAGYGDFVPALDYFMELLETPPPTLASEDHVAEWLDSWQLVLDRLAGTGRSGNARDIVEVLQEVLSVPPAEESAHEEEEDVEQEFLHESSEQIEQARNALKRLYETLEDRRPFKEIENAMHAVRSSAHILDKQTVVEFAVTLEECAEMFELEDIPVPEGLLPGLTEGLVMLEALIKDPNTDVSKVTADLEALLSGMMLEEEPAEEEVAAQVSASEGKKTAEEKPLFAEGEEPDEDLLDIFKEESEKFIHDLERSNQQLKENLYSEQALTDFSQAAHSLHSSAKMLGFREIAQLTAGLEDIVEAITNEEIENTFQLQERVARAVAAIKELSKGNKLSNTELAQVINLLDISRQKVQVFNEEEQDNAGDYMHQVFVEEAQELVEKLNQDMQELENMPESDTILVAILRNLHTLKGSAYMTKYTKIGDLAHKLEDYFEVYKEQSGDVKQEMIHPAFTAIDLIDDLVQTIKTDPQALPAQYTARLAEVDNKLFYFQRFDMETGPSSETQEKKESAPVPVRTGGRNSGNVIKIDTEYLDNLVNMATDLVVNRTELTAHFEHLKKLLQTIENEKKQLHQTRNSLEDVVEDISEKQDHPDIRTESLLEETPDLQEVSENMRVISHSIDEVTKELNRLSRDFEKNIQQISNLSKVLHTDILRVRMVPIETLFKRFPKAVREMAKEQGKRVTVTVQGNDTEMDRAMVEALADPLLHILRNAVDHGIEDPKTRAALGKKKTGSITMRARQDKSQVVIEVLDDGQGIDVEKVKATIVKKKIAGKKAVEQMTEAEILNYIFYPEFSTRETKGKVSGRGVGLDVVANQIQKLKGNIRIRTERNAGTVFSIRVPLTLVISQALLTEFHGKMIAIPMIAVQESLEIKEEDILVDDVRKYIQTHGKLLPYVTLDEILHFEENPAPAPPAETALILHDAGVSVALGIGRISGRQEIVIKSLGSQLQNVEYIVGGTILTNGEVALILDYTAVIRMVELQFFGNVRNPHSIREVRSSQNKPEMELVMEKQAPLRVKHTVPKKVIKDRKPRILIVDDSISLRSFVSGVLEREGFAPMQASDGPQALKILEEELVDLMITDLEMPEMHGFDLIAQIRKEQKYNELPIVILTGRSGKAQSDKGMELGANAFIGKPFKEGDLLQVVSGFFK